jgi:hypothetical protein
MDRLRSRIEQMQQSLQESNDRAATAEKKAAELAEALRKGRQLIKSLQSAVVTQQRSKLASSRTRDGSKHQDAGVAGPSTVKAQSSIDNAHQLSVQITLSYVSFIIICVIQRMNHLSPIGILELIQILTSPVTTTRQRSTLGTTPFLDPFPSPSQLQILMFNRPTHQCRAYQCSRHHCQLHTHMSQPMYSMHLCHRCKHVSSCIPVSTHLPRLRRFTRPCNLPLR